MPMCGFDKRMIEGLNLFHKGLVEHGIIQRAHNKNQSFKETIQRELEDMDRFLEHTSKIKDSEIREITESLTRYAAAFYKLVSRKGINNYGEVIEFLNQFYFEMDHKYYSELEGKRDGMLILAHHLNELGGKQNATKRI